MFIRKLVIVFVISLFPCVAGVSAGQDASEEEAASNQEIRGLKKGATEWGFLTGIGFAHEIWGAVGDRKLFLLGGRLGRILSHPRGPDFFKGHFEISVELFPVYLIFHDDATYAASGTLLFRQYLAPNFRIRPFISFGAGILGSANEFIPGAGRLQFTPQGGGGLAIFHRPDLAFCFEYRMIHISNADTTETNPGINASTLLFGVSFFR